MDAPNYFIPARAPHAFFPLASYLQPPAANVVAQYIETLTAPGDLVIDPFGVTPTIARVAFALGRRAISVESNPLWSWFARAMATPPTLATLNPALTRLGDALKDNAPLRVHLTQIYATTCAACGALTPADYFTHARTGGLHTRHYTCAQCGVTRDDPATEDDVQRFAAFDARGLHYYLAFERVVPAENLHADRIRKMLDVYTPRNLYALVTLTQKIDALFRTAPEHDMLCLLLLHVLDRGTNFYADAEPHTFAQLTAHKQFVEFNLWREIERAARALAATDAPPDLAESPDEVSVADTPTFYVGRGNAKTLAHEIPATAALIVTAPPVRRAAIWALSYFWGAWILGRTAVQALTPFLDPKKDAPGEWHWYTDALAESFKSLANLLRPEARAVLVFSATRQAVIETLLLAASGANLIPDSFLFQPHLGDAPRHEHGDTRGDYRIVFAPAHFASPLPLGARNLDVKIRAVALTAARDLLTRRGEALAFAWVHHAAYVRVAREGLIAQVLATKMKIAPSQFVRDAILAGLSEGYADDFDHSVSAEQTLWLRRARDLAAPLIDRVDDAVREILSRGEIARDDLADAIYRAFPGDLTPEAGLIDLCLAAYADHVDTERAHALEVLTQLGARLQYSVIASPTGIKQAPIGSAEIASSPTPLPAMTVAWLADGELAHGFVWRDRAEFTDLAQIHIAPARGYVIVPEARVAWLQEKLRRLPHLAEAFHDAGWNFVRVPFVEKLLAEEKIERHDITLMAGLVPLVAEEHAQLELFL